MEEGIDRCPCTGTTSHPERHADGPLVACHRLHAQSPQRLQADQGGPTRPHRPEPNDRTRTFRVRMHLPPMKSRRATPSIPHHRQHPAPAAAGRAACPWRWPVCRWHRAGASRPPPRSCVCAFVVFRETRQPSNGGRAARLPKLKWPRAKNLSVSQLVCGPLTLQGDPTLPWTRSTFRTESRRSVLFDTSTKPDTPVSWGAAEMGRGRR